MIDSFFLQPSEFYFSVGTGMETGLELSLKKFGWKLDGDQVQVFEEHQEGNGFRLFSDLREKT